MNTMNIFNTKTSPRELMQRRLLLCFVFLLTSAIAACQPTHTSSNTMPTEDKNVVYFDVSANSYYGRPIFDIMLNGVEIGVGGGGLMTGVAVPLGSQVITWRLGGPEGMTGNGDTVIAKNQPMLTRPDSKMRYLGVHIYPDNTVELIPDEFWPERTERGQALIDRAQEKKRGQ
jgi:hypothetical protein